jgi:hypothetical protein
MQRIALLLPAGLSQAQAIGRLECCRFRVDHLFERRPPHSQFAPGERSLMVKIFNSEFTQNARTCFFRLTEPPADGESFREAFLSRLRSKPWVPVSMPCRWKAPMAETTTRLSFLLLNLPPEYPQALVVARGHPRSNQSPRCQTVAGSRGAIELEK